MDSDFELFENLTEALRPEARTGDSMRQFVYPLGPEEIDIIPEHWLRQPEPRASMHYILGVLYVAFMFLGVIGNSLVIWVFMSAKKLRTPSNVFVVNLAFCDFLMWSKAPIFIYNSFNRGMALGVTGCQIFGLVGALSGIGAGMTNAFIAYDRYHVITNPLGGKLTMPKALLMLCFIWLYTIPLCLFPYFKLWGRYVTEGYVTACSFDYLSDDFDNKVFVAVLFTCSYAMPLSLIIYYYSQIVKHVFSHEKTLRAQAKKMNVDSLRSNATGGSQSAEIRISKAAITMCFLFIAAWTPYGTMALIGSFGNKELLTAGASMIPACACKLVAVIDPYVYAISHPRYRIELQKRLPWLAIVEKPEQTHDTASTVTSTETQSPAQEATA